MKRFAVLRSVAFVLWLGLVGLTVWSIGEGDGLGAGFYAFLSFMMWSSVRRRHPSEDPPRG